jgi:tetratricopeptide (TPR) repeat protein
MSVRATAILFAVGVELLGESRRCRAEAPPVSVGTSATQEEEFKAHLDSAITHYAAGRYAESIGKFEAAYLMKQLPAILYNLAQAHRRLGKAGQALRYLKLYEQTNPDLAPEKRADLRAQIESTQLLLRAVRGPGGDGEGAFPEDGAEPAPAPLVSVKTDGVRGLPKGLWIGIGVAGGLAIAGIVTGSMALSQSSALRGQSDLSAAEFDSAQTRLRSLGIATDALFYGSLITVTTTALAISIPYLLARPRRASVEKVGR